MNKLSGHDPSPISEQAAEWVVCLSADQISDEQRAAFASWLAQDPKHRDAYEEVNRLWQSVTPQQPRPDSRVKILLSTLILLGITYLLPLAEWTADERTRIGEMRHIALADGSILTLDSDSAVDIVYSTHERRVILHSGRLMADVALDPAAGERPFIVESRDGLATALGTRFIVAQAENDSLVNVIESRVAVANHDNPTHSVTLQTGESVRFNQKHISHPITTQPFATSWLQSRLVYQNEPLGQVIDDLERYHKGFLKISEDTDQLRFTGVLPTDDQEAALNILENALPVHIGRHTDWLTWISLRQPQQLDSQNQP